MEEQTLQLAQTLARQSLEEDEAEDGSPRPLRKTHVARLEGKLQGFR
jgi:hypothetical protein